MLNFTKFFLEKNGSFGEEKCWHFWKMNSFSNTEGIEVPNPFELSETIWRKQIVHSRNLEISLK